MQQEITHLRELLEGKDTNQTALLFDPQSRKKKELVAQIENSAMELKEEKARVHTKRHASIAGIAIKAMFGLILSSKWVLTKCLILVQRVFEGTVYDRSLYNDVLLDQCRIVVRENVYKPHLLLETIDMASVGGLNYRAIDQI